MQVAIPLAASISWGSSETGVGAFNSSRIPGGRPLAPKGSEVGPATHDSEFSGEGVGTGRLRLSSRRTSIPLIFFSSPATERFAEAVPRYRRVLMLNDQHAAAMRDLAHCLLMTGERREGRKWAKAAAHAGEPSVLNDLGTGRYGK